MKQSLNLKLSQGLKLTPQLKQSIRLLQLSSLELHTEVQEMLENNPLLEEELPKLDTDRFEREEHAKDEALIQSKENDWQESFETRQTLSKPSITDTPDVYATASSKHSLKQELLWQLNMLPLSPLDKQIAEAIIYSINSQGFLTIEIAEIKTLLDVDDETEIDDAEIEVILKLIQSFEPVGIAARNLQDRLQIILCQLENNTPAKLEDHTHILAKKIIAEHLDELAARNLNSLKTKLGATKEELISAIQYIQKINPRIEDSFEKNDNIYIIPDIIVKSVNNEWRVELNSQIKKQVRLNDTYISIPKENLDKNANKYINDSLQEAKWFIKSLNSRYDTLKRVATAIVRNQSEFFKHGDAALKPMVLQKIAQELDLHESTISRATSNKYMQTPLGVFELKYFFSTGLSSASGDNVSSTAIRSIIKKLIDEEQKQKPISDNKIAQALNDQGFKVARRTVAKYREAMNIPSSSKRKSLI